MNDLHPRPRLTRADWTDLCGAWQFSYDDADVGCEAHWQADAAPFDREIIVPFPPESEMSGIGDHAPHPICWYRREVRIVPVPGQRTLLHFGAVDHSAEVWVNGESVARHTGGHTPFSADITASLDASGSQVIVVRAEDRADALDQPRGKQDWQDEPHAIWYHRTSGIWQPVWLEVVPAMHVANVQFTPDLDRGCVSVEIVLPKVPVAPVTCSIVLSLEGRVLVSQTTELAHRLNRLTLHLREFEHGTARKHLLWTPDTPNLIDAEITLRSDPDGTTDTCRSYFGMRSCGVGGRRFLLNDMPCFVRSVLSQGFWPKSHLAAPDGDAIRREVELIKSLGFNAVRNHQKVEDPRFLYWCDRLGLMVWGELPSAYEYSTRMVRHVMDEWLEVIERDRSHPCVVTWVPINESWGVTDIARRKDQAALATALYSITRAMDPTRPVISNDGWEHTVSDILGVHDYSVLPEHLSARFGTAEGVAASFDGFGPARRRLLLEGGDTSDLPVMVTEFGGLSFHPASGQAWFGYATVTSEKAYLDALAGLFDALHDSTEIAGYCYTQFTDTLQETNGLLDENRKPKLPVEALHDMISRPSSAITGEFLDAARRAAHRSSGGTGG